MVGIERYIALFRGNELTQEITVGVTAEPAGARRVEATARLDAHPLGHGEVRQSVAGGLGLLVERYDRNKKH